jgi:MYXO-CTERM domain-containing protein
MLRLLKHLVVVVLFVIFAGCSGGGCSSGCSCGGITPLAEGFDASRRIENAASLRLTDSGLTFLEDNIGTLAGSLLGDMGQAGILTFDIPESNGSLLFIDYKLCPGGADPNASPPKCVAEIDLGNANLSITTEPNHNIRIQGPLPLRLQNLPINVDYGLFDEDVDMSINGNNACPGDTQTFQNVNLNVNVSIEIDPDTSHSRYGYSRIRIADLTVNESDIENGLEFCNGGFTGALLDAIKGLVIGFLVDGIVGTLGDTIEDALCQQANPELNPPCPTGTTNVDGVCRYGTDAASECASGILGMDGNIDLGGLLSGFSPGTKGSFDFLFAVGGHNLRDDGSGFAWGDLNPANNGATLSMYGGTEPTPTSSCVPLANVELPTGIPVPDELTLNTVANWPAMVEGPHFGMALSERFTNYMAAQAYNSGALCLGITADALGDAVPLTTALIGVGLGAPSMNELGRQKQGVPLAITVRPQTPPVITFGNGTNATTDPLIHIALNQVAFDFYVWSLDRYVRTFTALMDIEVPMNLMVDADSGLVPVIDNLGVNNATVTNSALLREDPAKIAGALEELLGGIVGSFLGDALPPIDLTSALGSLGVTLDIPPTVEGQGSPGLRLLTKGRDNFLGIFATLGVAPPMNANANFTEDGSSEANSTKDGQQHSVTSAELAELSVDPAGLHMNSFTADNAPKARLRVGSSLDNGSRTIEWQYKLNNGPWHSFTRSRWIDVDDSILRLQGKHTAYVRSRVVGDPASLDPEPMAIDLLIDDEAPRVAFDRESDGRVIIHATDAVSGDRTQMRLRFGHDDDGETVWTEWSEWTTSKELAPLYGDEGDVVEVEARDEDGRTATVQQSLIRGRSTADGGCECRAVPGHSSGDSSSHWWLIAGLGLIAGLRRRRTFWNRPASTTNRALGKTAGQLAMAASVVIFAGLFAGCSCSGDDVVTPGCRGRGDCSVLRPGLVGAYTSADTAPDGTVWVSGYLEANWEQDYSYGDLVVGRLNGDEVDWKVIDGIPADAPALIETFDPKGFRGGVVDAGEDVGMWTSLDVDDSGNPGVAYYDATNRALKYARYDGSAWSSTEVQRIERGDAGKYASLTFVAGRPVIAYLFVEPGDSGTVRSGVRVATGSGADTNATWSIEEVSVDNATPCQDYNCGSDSCVIITGVCQEEVTGCPDDCGDECHTVAGQPSCEPVRSASSSVTYPDAHGLYISTALRPDGSIGIAFYDRIKGNLMVARAENGSWTTVIVDGESGGEDNGDKGVGTSLAIDGNDVFHISYVDGLNEAVNYVAVAGGVTPAPPEMVDTGLGAADGQHVVGDDSNIYVTQGGEIHIAYQDASDGQLRFAVGAGTTGANNWNVRAVDQEGFAGWFAQQIEVNGGVQVLNWWRVASPAAEGNVRLITP